MAKAKEATWSEERLIWELAQLVRLAVPPSQDNLKKFAEWGKQFNAVHPDVAQEIADEAKAKVEAEQEAKAEAEAKAKDDAEAMRPAAAPKKNEDDDDEA
jgi:hypothetical protein